MERNVESIKGNDTEIYLIIIESEEYWNISRVIFATLIIFIIFRSLSLFIVTTPFIILSFLEKGNDVTNFSMETLKKAFLKKFVFGHLDVDVEEVDTLKDTSSSCTDIIEGTEEQRPTIVHEMEWRGLKNQAIIYRQRGSNLSPAGSRIDYEFRFFMGEEDVEEVKTSIEDDVEEGKIQDDVEEAKTTIEGDLEEATIHDYSFEKPM